jgi:DNA-binding transcriptional regulator YiaG
MPNQSKTSIGYKIGRIVAIAEYASSLAGKEMRPTEVSKGIMSPLAHVVKWQTRWIIKDERMNNRMSEVCYEIDADPGFPAQLTEAQQSDAWIGYYAEKAAIERDVKISKYRAQLGLTQEEFAERIGVKRNTVSCWESHRRDCPKDIIENVEKMVKTGGQGNE